MPESREGGRGGAGKRSAGESPLWGEPRALGRPVAEDHEADPAAADAGGETVSGGRGLCAELDWERGWVDGVDPRYLWAQIEQRGAGSTQAGAQRAQEEESASKILQHRSNATKSQLRYADSLSDYKEIDNT